ncbi:hypothetical protein [uncultured Tateyamaria sp.]|uniref:hypothetical protein n=1 Tax=uncultured Tateyamaria sp. TaxID=455651 RepID=UPI002612580B|nr:hypothetical protein [uncultured Tateyamaria sp.]
MYEHDWIIEVCEDLRAYARKHNLAHLEAKLNTALTAAQHEALLARVDAQHQASKECAMYGARIGLWTHKGTEILLQL